MSVKNIFRSSLVLDLLVTAALAALAVAGLLPWWVALLPLILSFSVYTATGIVLSAVFEILKEVYKEREDEKPYEGREL